MEKFDDVNHDDVFAFCYLECNIQLQKKRINIINSNFIEFSYINDNMILAHKLIVRDNRASHHEN